MPLGIGFIHGIIACSINVSDDMDPWDKDDVNDLRLVVRREYMICSSFPGILIIHSAVKNYCSRILQIVLLERSCGHLQLFFNHKIPEIFNFMRDGPLKDRSY